MQTASRRVINGWALYDWANSVYSLVITSTIFPSYYAAMTGDGNPETLNDPVRFLGRIFPNSALYNYALAIAFLLVAILSPILSSIADFKGNKKKFLRFFMTMGSIACSALYFYDESNLSYGLFFTIIASLGFWGSLVFYNSYLPEIAAPADRDRISAKGFAYGYVGSVILQVICFLFVLKPDWFGITVSKGSQISFLLVGVWWFVFASIALSRLPKPIPAGTDNTKSDLTNGYRELRKVWNQVKQMPVLRTYLMAFFFFNMGVQTVMLAATMFGKEELGIPQENLVVAILIIQLIAIGGAYLMARLSAAIGNLKTLMICVVIWIGVCAYAYQIPSGDIMQFYLVAAVIGLIMGGIQALARSTYAKLMPPTRDTASFFSFYDVSEKIGIVVGLFSFGLLTDITGSQRSSVLALMIFFIIGLVLLLITRSVENKKQKHESL